MNAKALRVASALLAAGALAGLAACTGYAPRHLPAGATLAEVTAQLGPATGRYPGPGGSELLEFARGPYGKHTYRVSMDANGRVTSWEQVLTEERFNLVRDGMPVDQVLALVGRPSERRSGGWQGGEVWSWRYETVICQWFQISVIGGVARAPAYGPDPLCEVHDRDDRAAN